MCSCITGDIEREACNIFLCVNRYTSFWVQKFGGRGRGVDVSRIVMVCMSCFIEVILGDIAIGRWAFVSRNS